MAKSKPKIVEARDGNGNLSLSLESMPHLKVIIQGQSNYSFTLMAERSHGVGGGNVPAIGLTLDEAIPASILLAEANRRFLNVKFGSRAIAPSVAPRRKNLPTPRRRKKSAGRKRIEALGRKTL